eukprot:1137828-Pelagomonas_calceolata.AAC.15
MHPAQPSIELCFTFVLHVSQHTHPSAVFLTPTVCLHPITASIIPAFKGHVSIRGMPAKHFALLP